MSSKNQLLSQITKQYPTSLLQMDSSLPELWLSASNGAFLPAVGKSAQFYLAFVLLLTGLILTAVFGLSMSLLSLSDKIKC